MPERLGADKESTIKQNSNIKRGAREMIMKWRANMKVVSTKFIHQIDIET